METPDQHLWIATGDGTLNELTLEGKMKVHRAPPSTQEAPTWRRALSHMVPLNEHELVMVSQDGFVSLFDRRTERFSRPPWSLELRDARVVDAQSPDIAAQKIKLIPNIPLGFYPIGLHGIGSILSLMVDKQGDLWLGTQTGLYHKRAQESILRLVHASLGSMNLDQHIVNVLTQDPKGRLLLTLNDVLMWYDPQTHTLDEVLKSKRLKKEVPAAHLMAAFLQGEHILWLGTQGHGLYRVDLKEQNYRMLTSADGLPNNTLYAVLEDRSKKLWWSSNLGLVRLDPQTLALRSYQACDGLQSNEFNQAAATVGPTGTLYFGGVQGVTYFRPERLQDNPVAPKISIKTLRKFDVISPLQRDEAGTLNAEIGYKENYFSIEYVALDLTDPRQNRYRYRLQGFENDWHEVGSQRIASYTSLPGGTYQFQVQASNNHGIWNEEGASLQVVVIPPPWKTWWAYTLYALTPLLALYVYARAQAQRLEKERAINEQLRRVDRLKDEFLANTSHELRTPLNGIIGLAESMVDGATGELNRETLANLDMIVTSGRRLSHLINDILDFSRLRHRDLSLSRKAMSLQPVVELVMTLLKPLTAGKKLVMYNELTPELPLVEADENRLQQIFNNLIGNALKFTEQGQIHVYAIQHGEHLEITVADTGIGIPEDKLDSVFQSFEQVDGSISRKYGGTGLGLAITRQLVELHGGTIYCESTI
ncbi:MAG: ATP-binding protein [Myxococcota bacterium]